MHLVYFYIDVVNKILIPSLFVFVASGYLGILVYARQKDHRLTSIEKCRRGLMCTGRNKQMRSSLLHPH